MNKENASKLKTHSGFGAALAKISGRLNFGCGEPRGYQ